MELKKLLNILNEGIYHSSFLFKIIMILYIISIIISYNNVKMEVVYSQANTRLVWNDEFEYSGLPDPNKWDYDVGGHGWWNDELQYYTKNRIENAIVKDGRLIITANKEEYGDNSYTSARLVTRGKMDWRYGRFEIKAKLPVGKGTWAAIWMMPVDNKYGYWPNSCEIDIMEHVGFDLGNIHASIHTLEYNWRNNNHKSGSIMVEGAGDDFHVYSLEWTPNKIEMFVDEISYFIYEKESEENLWKVWPFDQQFYLILNIAVGGNWGGLYGIDDSIWPQIMEIEYVRVYEYINYLHGDVNGDGIVTNVDLIILRRYIAGIEVNGFDEDAADANVDGKITNVDIILLSRYLAGIIENLGPQ